MRLKEGNKGNDILVAAIKVFAESGYHNAKIHKIAELAGVATGSIYVYYKNKETILQKIFSQLWERLYNELNAVSKRTDINSVEKVDALMDLLFDMFIQDPALAVVFVNEQNYLVQKSPKEFTPYYQKFIDLGECIVVEGINNSTFTPDIDVKIIRSFIFGGLRLLLHQWAQDPQEYPLDKIRHDVKYFSKRGLQK
ncbi:MAG: TetR/AcrR family transcriptional regulator [Ignavibacteria bacterium]|nr:TetR/AcrR family transcriptional regulator [Ignavibacteria bacterium]MCU7498413.1 TetR/AcrR family transcriptional regulator [Ignavibacteria bacterium]MCU7511955.1 TetR/AcrR family transcriptional regulator [Ignavibacteria bacterium]MCU7520012.1 TetR/AcrR family transcriptional regulator [Ignavibacteria bacterium]MCU7523087.1 TetR/AcrR family transcriptional regulator [Ignavibacteria bacterium]